MVLLNLKKSDFDGTFLKSYQNDLVLIFFKMKNCKYCIEFEPVYKELSIKYKHNIIFTIINIDEEKEFINELKNDYLNRFDIKTFPTILLFKQGYFLSKYYGSRDKNIFISALNNMLINNK